MEVVEFVFWRGGCTQSMGQDYKEKHKLDSNKSQTHRAKQYEVTSFLSTDCELSTETCSKNVYSLGPMSRMHRAGRFAPHPCIPLAWCLD